MSEFNDILSHFGKLFVIALYNYIGYEENPIAISESDYTVFSSVLNFTSVVIVRKIDCSFASQIYNLVEFETLGSRHRPTTDRDSQSGWPVRDSSSKKQTGWSCCMRGCRGLEGFIERFFDCLPGTRMRIEYTRCHHGQHFLQKTKTMQCT